MCSACYNPNTCGHPGGCSSAYECWQNYANSDLLHGAVWETSGTIIDSEYDKVIDVSALTVNGPVTLTSTFTKQWTGPNTWIFSPVGYGADALGGGNTRFVLTQTRRGFRLWTRGTRSPLA
jgi:hypothetical protein